MLDALKAPATADEPARSAVPAAAGASADRQGTEAAAALELLVDEMTCASCVGRVERALSRVPGVGEASVNLATSRATVRWQPGVAADPAPLLAALEKAGYPARALLADAVAEDRQADLERASHDRRDGLQVALGLALSLPLVLPMLLAPFGVSLQLPPLWQWGLATPVQFVLGARFYRAAWGALRAGTGNMDLLVALGTSAAYGLSLVLWLAPPVGTAHAHGASVHLYFESAAVVIALVRLGKWLEARARHQTLASLDALRALRPETARLRRPTGEVTVPLSALRVGDEMVVLPGERVPADGRILEGRSHLDEAVLTGESLPVPREPGETVAGGAINGEGRLVLQATAVGAETQLARIVRLVESAQARKAPIQQTVDRISAVFVPAVVVIALLTVIGWMWAGQPIEPALIHGVAVLVIACPCALGLATPATFMVGTGLAARRGILVRDPQAIEQLRQVAVVAFDKTGTLTLGHPRLMTAQALPGDPSLDDAGVLAQAAALQRGSEHPLARAVLDAADGPAGTSGGDPPATGGPRGGPQGNRPEARDIVAAAGRGIEGRIGGSTWRLGSSRWRDECGLDAGALAAAAAHGAAQGWSLSWLMERPEAAPGSGDTAGWRLRGLLAFGDEVKPQAAAAVAWLHRLGLRTVMISGDHRAAADAVARRVGIEDVRSDVLPADKAAAVTALREGDPPRRVAMVGDGVNDAPALAAADVGLAMSNPGGGTDLALQTAGLTLLQGDPLRVPEAVELSRAIARKLHQNLFWAFAYNVVGIPLAAAGWLSPMVAGAAMALSSTCVIGNALLLRRWRPSVR